MFFHNFKYTFKILLKNKTLVFWSIVWPLILVSLFNMAFSNMINSEQLDTIDIGVVDNENYKKQEYLSSTLGELSDKQNENYMFNITYESHEKLNELLEDKKIDGYIECNKDEIKIIVKENGINQTVIKYVLDEVKEYEELISRIVMNKATIEMMKGQVPDTNKIVEGIMSKLNENKECINNKSNRNMDYMMIEYYTVIAMASLYSCLISSEAVKNYLANINKKGARVTLAPIKRITLLFSGLLASFIIQIISIAVLLLYTKYGLKVDYGSRIDLVILLSIIGSLAGLTLGVVVGSATLKNDNTRIGIMNVIVMLGCFFSGMMGVTMKYIIDSNVPIINKLNPANMITDGFYSLYYYESLNRFYFNLISLLIFMAICMFISFLMIRRKRYDSI